MYRRPFMDVPEMTTSEKVESLTAELRGIVTQSNRGSAEAKLKRTLRRAEVVRGLAILQPPSPTVTKPTRRRFVTMT
jgi:hypothetical protein